MKGDGVQLTAKSNNNIMLIGLIVNGCTAVKLRKNGHVAENRSITKPRARSIYLTK